jgi:rRNA maturation RNase YbeY
MIAINVSNLQKKLPVRKERIRKFALKIIRGERPGACGCLNICFTDDALIKKLNAEFLGMRAPTDVLAFDLGGNKNRILADIAISTDTVRRNAKRFKARCEDEMMLCVAHGILHIMGFDDHTQKQKRAMRGKEKEYVNR